ncbi:rodlin [Streptomyces spirodelae]|uniref:RdlA protein n=1 Tax=Streptomyces spirodelae TaxID=2812904 RepID=A0ABS3X3S7_9ACTN|nr:rodlin [Streptomyces spirodelae]MBO8190031.1 RdlA protein [Streptomyces spirodelae]
MIKHALATAAAATAIVGVAAPQAMATGNDHGPTTVNGNGADQMYGNSATYGNWSPQFALIQGSLNKPCIALPDKLNLGSLIGLIPITVQDINLLSSKQTQTCVENSTQTKGDEPLSHFLQDIPLLSGNGTGNR